ncbi:MAG: hypothetical protein K2R98_04410 [Gemmataceae bacterium]|nr:hypothetical protein [Gemmataceae bacterium]
MTSGLRGTLPPHLSLGEVPDRLVQATLRAALRVARSPLATALVLPPETASLVSEGLDAVAHRWESQASWPT